jgi:hypothetical protein
MTLTLLVYQTVTCCGTIISFSSKHSLGPLSLLSFYPQKKKEETLSKENLFQTFNVNPMDDI